MLTYLYGILIRCEDSSLHEGYNITEPPFTPIIKSGNLTKIDRASTIVQAMLPNNQKALYDVLGCYSAGIKFMYDGFYPEALITFFRVFESIGLHAFQGFKKNELHFHVDKTIIQNNITSIIKKSYQIQMRDMDYSNLTNEFANKVVSKIKNESYSLIEYLLTQNKIPYNPMNINDIVQMRNNITHMKSTSHSTTDIENICYETQRIIKQLIALYFWKKKHNAFQLMSKIEY